MAIIDLTNKNPAEIAHGWMYLGLCINLLLLGVLTTMMLTYHTTYKSDRWWIKILVSLLYVADFLNSCFTLAYLYLVLIINFGNFDMLQRPDWIFACDPSLTALIGMTVQLFFAWRVFVLTKSSLISGLIVTVAVVGGIFGLMTAIKLSRIQYFVELLKLKAFSVTWLSCEAVADLSITTTLVWYLYRKHKTGFQNTDQIVDRIIRLTVQTGLLTMIVALLNVVFYLADPSGLHLMFNIPLSKLYSISVMSSLNSRRGWQFGKLTVDTSVVDSIGGRRQGPVSKASNQSPGGTFDCDPKAGPPEVYVHVEFHEMCDVNGEPPSSV
ncbi:hypothetical protein CPB83DRAFT_892255 [Crepidotus variabilis]|uniref:DUF6534 domain-containing protein n=1 Tax=Crepidotus variabilis TaxID=179855 RepID=A0A9P6EL94_9AGAR|nr:hypothetical protein CPB83DRAFT_892255 [Crepidotus variabilis]